MGTIEILKKSYTLLSKKRKKQAFFLFIIMLISAFAELALAAVVSLLGVALSSPESLQKLPIIGKFFQNIATVYTMPPVVSMLTSILIFLAIATSCKNILTAYMSYRQGVVSQSIGWDVVQHIFSKYLYAPYSWHAQQNTSELHNHLAWRTYVANLWTATLSLCTQLVIMAFLMLGAFFASPGASFLLYGVCGSMALLIYKLTQKKVRALSVKGANITMLAHKTAHFALQGMREVHIYNQREAFNKEYVSFGEPSVNVSSRQGIYPSVPLWVLESLGMFLLLGAVLFLYFQGKSVVVITGTLTLLAGVSWRLLPAMNKLVSAILQIKANVGVVSNLFLKYLDIPQEQAVKKQYSFTKSIQLEKVDFVYPQAPKKALEGIDLSILKGSMVGLVGLSGAGKSTLVGILTGLLKPSSGSILLDSKPIEPTSNFLNIGYVPQSPYIMDATLAENVAFSDWGREIDEECVLECCRMAAMTFLDDLPEGIHTTLGDRGVRLSGGQVQRVAIARALYTNPEILLFDEATSALDGAAEEAIQKTIVNLRENMTIVIVAHRLSTVEGCDKIYWIDKGRVIPSGNSAETLQAYTTFLNENNIVDK